MKVALIDYGAGNLHSLGKALMLAGAQVGLELELEADPLRALRCDAIVLPGVGAFGAAAEQLAPARATLRTALRDGLPCLAICLGMQLLFDSSEEGAGEGIGLLAGEVTRLSTRRVPHMGWNTLEDTTDTLVRRSGLRDVYYAHSFACRPADLSAVGAWSHFEDERFPAVVRAARTLGVQFHPEKSSAQGLALLKAFVCEVAR